MSNSPESQTESTIQIGASWFYRSEDNTCDVPRHKAFGLLYVAQFHFGQALRHLPHGNIRYEGIIMDEQGNAHREMTGSLMHRHMSGDGSYTTLVKWEGIRYACEELAGRCTFRATAYYPGEGGKKLAYGYVDARQLNYEYMYLHYM